MAVGTRRTIATPLAVEDAPTTSKRTSKPSKSFRTKSVRPSRSPKTAETPRTPKPVTVKVPGSSSGTVTPDEMPDTPPISQREYHDLKNALQELEDQQYPRHRVHKSRSRRHRRHRRYDSSDSDLDSEEGEGPMVSFLHAKGTYPFLTLHERYRSVEIKYFKQIFFGTFRPTNLLKLSRSVVDRPGDDGTHEAKGMVQLLQAFEVYGQAVCHYAHPTIALRLQMALSDYRFRLAELSNTYKFDSVREYNSAFMITRILHGQDDSKAWTEDDRRCRDLLVRRSTGETKPNPGPASKSSRICRKYNKGRCAYEHRISSADHTLRCSSLRRRPLLGRSDSYQSSRTGGRNLSR